MKKNVILAISFILFILVGFVIGIVLHTKSVEKYWYHQSHIIKTDSLNCLVFETRFSHGYLSFNQEFIIFSGYVDEPNIKFWEVSRLELPFLLQKEANNDTIYIYTDDAVYYFVFTD